MVFWFCENKGEPNWTIVSKTRTKPKPDDFLSSEPNPKELEPIVTLLSFY
jgi:hypothetical protein